MTGSCCEAAGLPAKIIQIFAISLFKFGFECIVFSDGNGVWVWMIDTISGAGYLLASIFFSFSFKFALNDFRSLQQ